MKTFAHRLESFTLSADNVDNALFERIMRIIHNFSHDAIGVDAISVLIERADIDADAPLVLVRADGKLTVVESHDPNKLDIRLHSYKTGKPLWVVGKNEGLLVNSDELLDQWSEYTGLTEYKAPPEINNQTKTSIVMPLRRQSSEIFGVVSFDSSRYEAISDRTRSEFEKIAESISHLYRMSEYNKEQRDGTEAAIKGLESDIIEERLCSLLKKPTIFLASSSKAENDVIGVIHEVIEEFTDKLDYKFWGEMYASGNINTQLISEITECTFGICYFSDRTA